MKNLEKKVSKFQKTFEKRFKAIIPDANVFRLLLNKNFNFKNKNILDIGIGYGANLLEFKNRGAKDLDEERADNFHSVTALLLFMSRRSRPYIQSAIDTYMPKKCTLVARPNNEDD